MRKGRIPFIITFLAPALVLYAVFVISPFAQGIQISFTNWLGVSSNFDYVGISNYRDLMGDEAWWHAATNNLKLLVVLPIVTLSIALFFAVLLTRGGAGGTRRRLPGSGIYRVLFFFPQIIPVVVIAILFQFIYSPVNGLLAQVLRFLGIDLNDVIPNGPIGNPGFVLWAVAFVSVWAGVGFFMVLFLAGIQQIPRDLFEAAAIDGANKTRMFFSVTLPLLWNHIQVAVVFIAVHTLDMFVLVNVMARNGIVADYGADVMGTQIYRAAFSGNSLFGYASAMATTLLVFSLALAMITFRATRRERHEY